MRVVVGLAGALLVVLMLSEFFVAFLLPRRVKRDPRIARGIYQAVWKPWRAVARRLRPIRADALLGYFGPLALLLELVLYPVAIHYKGSGFYSTDYGKRKAAKDGGDSGSSSGGDTAKTESKPAAPEKKAAAGGDTEAATSGSPGCR